MRRVLIVEDHKSTLEWLEHMVREMDERLEVYAVDNVKAAYECAMTRTIHLFLVDIILDTGKLNDASGLKFVENMRQMDKYTFTPIIIITALEDPRLHVYEDLHCFGYVEKPFDTERLKRMVEECLKFREDSEKKRMLYFRQDGIIYGVNKEDIIYAESINHTIYIHSVSEERMHIRYRTIKQFLDEVDNYEMIQCSRNTVVNTNYVSNIDIPNGVLQLKGNYGKIEIGFAYKKKMKEFFKSKLL